MSGFGKQGQGMGSDACDHQQGDVDQGHGERYLENPRWTTRAVDVHTP